MAKPTEENKKKVSIHERSGDFDNNLTIYEIEKALHPRSKELITDELTKILDRFVDANVDGKGNIKDPNKAADNFLELLAKYHFGEAYDAIKHDKGHITESLKSKYRISRNSLIHAFKRKGAYKRRDDFYAAHRDPLVNAADEAKKGQAQESLNYYLHDEDARKEIPEHIETRTGKKLSKSYKSVLDLETTLQLIGTYMALPGAVEKIENDKKAKLDLPDASAGHPSLYNSFEGGDKYHDAYREEAKKVGETHKLKGKKAD